jgi:phosphoenolpyruvate synthase/pyruvate phosphate dikinase
MTEDDVSTLDRGRGVLGRNARRILYDNFNRLFDLAIRLEQAAGSSMDFEFAFRQLNDLYMLQARPIITKRTDMEFPIVDPGHVIFEGNQVAGQGETTISHIIKIEKLLMFHEGGHDILKEYATKGNVLLVFEENCINSGVHSRLITQALPYVRAVFLDEKIPSRANGNGIDHVALNAQAHNIPVLYHDSSRKSSGLEVALRNAKELKREKFNVGGMTVYELARPISLFVDDEVAEKGIIYSLK